MKTLAALPLEIPAEAPIQYGRKWARSAADVPKGRKIVQTMSSGAVYYETTPRKGKKKEAEKPPSINDPVAGQAADEAHRQNLIGKRDIAKEASSNRREQTLATLKKALAGGFITKEQMEAKVAEMVDKEQGKPLSKVKLGPAASLSDAIADAINMRETPDAIKRDLNTVRGKDLNGLNNIDVTFLDKLKIPGVHNEYLRTAVDGAMSNDLDLLDDAKAMIKDRLVPALRKLAAEGGKIPSYTKQEFDPNQVADFYETHGLRIVDVLKKQVEESGKGQRPRTEYAAWAKKLREPAKTGVVEAGPVKIDLTKVPDKPEAAAKAADKASEQIAKAKEGWFERFMGGAAGFKGMTNKEYKEHLSTLKGQDLTDHLDRQQKVRKTMDDAELFTSDFFKGLSSKYGLPMAAAIWSCGLVGSVAGAIGGSALDVSSSALVGATGGAAVGGYAGLLTGDPASGAVTGAMAGGIGGVLGLAGGKSGREIVGGAAWFGKHAAMAPLVTAGDMWNGVRKLVNAPKRALGNYPQADDPTTGRGPGRAGRYAKGEDQDGGGEVDMAEAKELAAKEWAGFFADWFEHQAEDPLDDEDDDEYDDDDPDQYAAEDNETIGKKLSLAKYPMECPIRYDCGCESCASGQPEQYCMEGASRGKPGPCPKPRGQAARAAAGEAPSKAPKEIGAWQGQLRKGEHHKPLPAPGHKKEGGPKLKKWRDGMSPAHVRRENQLTS